MEKHYRKFGIAMLFAFAISTTTKIYSQEKTSYSLSLEESRQVTRYVQNCKIYSVSQKDVGSDKPSKRTTFFIDDKAIVSSTFSGTFIKLPQDYILVRYDVNGLFTKNELTTDLQGQYNMGFDKPYPLIQNVDTKQFYYVMSEDYLPTVDVIVQRRTLLLSLHKLGYQEYERGGETYIKTKTAEIKLDTWTFSELKANPSYLTTFDNDQTKIAALVKQTVPHSKILDKYVNIYNIKGRNMSSIDIKTWRAATANAQKLQDQIYKITKKYEGNYSYKLFDQSDTHEVFVNNLRASKSVLNM